MNLVGVYNFPAFVSMSGLACGITACWLSLKESPELAVVALIWAGIFDLLDGPIARRQQRSEVEAGFGVQIDSLIDMVSFGIAPIMIAYAFGASGAFAFIVSVLYVSAACQRLAYFNVQQIDAKGALQFYTGLPVTFSALIFGVLFSIHQAVSQELFSLSISILFLIVGALFILPIKIPKPKGIIYFLMPFLASVFTVFWLYIFVSQ